MMGPPGDKEFDDKLISLAVSTQYTNVTDRLMDRQTDGHLTTAKTALCVASRSKKLHKLEFLPLIYFKAYLRISIAKLLKVAEKCAFNKIIRKVQEFEDNGSLLCGPA